MNNKNTKENERDTKASKIQPYETSLNKIFRARKPCEIEAIWLFSFGNGTKIELKAFLEFSCRLITLVWKQLGISV